MGIGHERGSQPAQHTSSEHTTHTPESTHNPTHKKKASRAKNRLTPNNQPPPPTKKASRPTGWARRRGRWRRRARRWTTSATTRPPTSSPPFPTWPSFCGPGVRACVVGRVCILCVRVSGPEACELARAGALFLFFNGLNQSIYTHQNTNSRPRAQAAAAAGQRRIGADRPGGAAGHAWVRAEHKTCHVWGRIVWNASIRTASADVALARLAHSLSLSMHPPILDTIK